jgi:hypothetical protein
VFFDAGAAAYAKEDGKGTPLALLHRLAPGPIAKQVAFEVLPLNKSIRKILRYLLDNVVAFAQHLEQGDFAECSRGHPLLLHLQNSERQGRYRSPANPSTRLTVIASV